MYGCRCTLWTLIVLYICSAYSKVTVTNNILHGLDEGEKLCSVFFPTLEMDYGRLSKTTNINATDLSFLLLKKHLTASHIHNPSLNKDVDLSPYRAVHGCIATTIATIPIASSLLLVVVNKYIALATCYCSYTLFSRKRTPTTPPLILQVDNRA